TTYESKAIYLGTLETAEALKPDDAEGPVMSGTGEERAKTQSDIEVTFLQKNKFSVGEEIEIMKPDGTNIKAKAIKMYDKDGNETDSCPHASVMVRAILRAEGGTSLPEAGDVMRRCV
ncbi:MAG: U32 family peptidase C-terminal domain-containing protein, partial [Lachnospiraceae bacterium]|nr:U32 family peptidase C-terminal domain-containing protein [Lachnospiraceae bacterium]